ncbi:uncharacterized protein LOC142616239 [Castanea sativa]|uniref:uncharacterized protein LOC142616239 n=1 Tax=Castanea sativa TaxID=21020 RepID=UPI003F651E8E
MLVVVEEEGRGQRRKNRVIMVVRGTCSQMDVRDVEMDSGFENVMEVEGEGETADDSSTQDNSYGRISKWGMILGTFDIKYMARTSIKGQILADLVTEFATSLLEEEGEKQNMDGKSVGMVSLQEPLSWKVYVDGAVNQRGSGVGLVVVSPEKIIIEKSLRLGFLAMNNEAKYEALLVGMTMVQKMKGRIVELFSDSRLVISQVKGELEARDLRMEEYLNQVRHLKSGFKSFTLQQITRS